ncbi:hypothetical protein [Cellulomonas composti]|uniref:Uncharacterized protein n=1 Tax=Cellulomonas composti TaxID=266130 RepID=A0A511J8N5_9CELL|nr:hypothetical protein [Cellulomonas composti]GEL94083.1 hypothetical protein CCO02nite_07410 [Cellulomonas composti]
MTDPTADESRTAMLAGLESFTQRTEASLARLRDIQTQIDALVAPPQPTAVHAEMDADGLVTELTIDRDLPPDELEHEIALAISDATRRRPAMDPEALRTQARAVRAEGVSIEALLQRVLTGNGTFTGASSATEPEPHWNQRRTVAVTVQSGVVRGIRCDHRWLGSSMRDAVAREVRDTVNDAVRADGAAGGL